MVQARKKVITYQVLGENQPQKIIQARFEFTNVNTYFIQPTSLEHLLCVGHRGSRTKLS